MERQYTIISGYRKDEKLRKSFNALAGKVFGIDFEDWYQNGFWSDCYCPYSIAENGEVIANVSVNRMEFDCMGQKKTLIQLGTVMTDPAFRGKGLIRRLMEEIEAEYSQKTDGFYLFANDSVLDFYPRFGYRKAAEIQYVRAIDGGRQTARCVPMNNRADWTVFERVIGQSTVNSAFDMINNPGLVMFYLTKFMSESVYYIEEQDAYAVAEKDGDTLILHQIFAKNIVKPEETAACFGSNFKQLVLGFTPLDRSGYQARTVHEEDTTLFVKGSWAEEMETMQAMFPLMSHA